MSSPLTANKKRFPMVVVGSSASKDRRQFNDVTADPDISDVAKLVAQADILLRKCSIYSESKELEDFTNLVARIRQNQGLWEEKLRTYDSEDLQAGNPRAWESLEEAKRKLEEEFSRVFKLRKSVERSLLPCSVGCHSTEFPQDLTDAFQQVVECMEPIEKIEELVDALLKALKDHADENISQLLKEIRAELTDHQSIGLGGKKNISLMHRAAFGGMESLMRTLVRLRGRASNINAQDSDGQTPLHYATIAGQTGAARILLDQPKLRANEEDLNSQTALQIAFEMKKKDIEKLLMERQDVQQYVDRMFRNRQVYVDAANAILVGAALIASVTFGGWLQPPGGFMPYYNFPSPYPAPPDTYESYAQVATSNSVRVFWVMNSLSFFSAVATVIAGAGCVLPIRDAFIKDEVKVVRRSLVMTSTLLVISIIFVLGAFAAGGYASLPPMMQYLRNIIITVALGSVLCVGLLIWFTRRLYLIRPEWWRQMELNMISRPANKRRKQMEYYFIN